LAIDLAVRLTDIAVHGDRDLMHRVRIGITGLAVVFLVVLLAAAVVGFHSKNKGGNASNAAEASNNAMPPADPLAELGVAPGNPAGESSKTQPNTAKR
jgi:hypothetical protein